MCGITGWLSSTKSVDKNVIKLMTSRLVHRGPDGSGIWVCPQKKVGLGHRRLSIVDLSTSANQPMEDDKKSVVISFNGEIYNHSELRRELEANGVRFYTDHSDTETLLLGYRYWGIEGLLTRLNGMFAFAIYDQNRQKVYLVRDRLGIKPLYYVEKAGQVLFASEAKAILTHPDIEAKLDEEQFFHYLSFRSLPAPYSLFKNFKKLAPGQYIEINLPSMQLRTVEYWDPLKAAYKNQVRYVFDEPANQLEVLLQKSVSCRLMADVPVGVFLSGGVDSAYLATLTAHATEARTDAFTVTYPSDPAYDEGVRAREIAKSLMLVHHEVPVDSTTFVNMLASVAYYQDEPIAAPVCLPMFLLSREARRNNVPVILAGEGSDEIFVGYSSWLRARDLQKLDNRLPDLPGRYLRRFISSLSNRLASPMSRVSAVLRRSSLGQPIFWGGALDFTEEGKHWILAKNNKSCPDTFDAIVRPIWNRFLESSDADDVTAWMTYIDLKFRLPELMLPRLDKMGMAFSIEGRVPFLDHRIVEFVLGLHPKLRCNGGNETKALFKLVASRLMPHDFVYQRKRGFRAPVKDWKSTDFGKRYLPGLLEFGRRTELFDPKSLRTLLCTPGDRLYFSLINFMLWYLIFIENVLPGWYPEIENKVWEEHSIV